MKKRSNQEPPAASCTSDASASTGPSRKKKRAAVPSEPAESVQEGTKKEKKELIWGYGTGVAAAFTPEYGDVVLAEDTQGFHANDITHFHPLSQQSVVALGFFPPYLTADAAFDAWHVHEAAVRHRGRAAQSAWPSGLPARR